MSEFVEDIKGLAIAIVGIFVIFCTLRLFVLALQYPVSLVVAPLGVIGYRLVAGWRRRHAPPAPPPTCPHGVPLGPSEANDCPECWQEARAAENEQRRTREELRRQREAIRQAAHSEWLRRVRLPEYLKTIHPKEFEELVSELYSRIGYRTETTPYVADNGVDAYLYKDGQKTILQCKRIKGTVGEPVLRDLFGAMHAEGAGQAIVVTTGHFSRKAHAWARGKPITLVGLERLRSLIDAHFPEDEVVPREFEPNPALENPCPQCGSQLRKVLGRRGPFLGCTRYPECRYTRSLNRR